MNLPWLITLTTVVPALVLVVWSYRFVLRARRSAGWPLVAATIVESRVLQQGNTRGPRLAFDYAMAAQRHTGRRLWVGPTSISMSGTWADRVVARYPVGAAVRVAVDPADPAYAVLEPGLRAAHWLPLALGIGIMAGGLFVAVVS